MIAVRAIGAMGAVWNGVFNREDPEKWREWAKVGLIGLGAELAGTIAYDVARAQQPALVPLP